MSRLVVTDRGLKRDALKDSTLNDRTRSGSATLDFESDDGCLRLDILKADGALSTPLERRDV